MATLQKMYANRNFVSNVHDFQVMLQPLRQISVPVMVSGSPSLPDFHMDVRTRKPATAVW
jgi:hypothetical protein